MWSLCFKRNHEKTSTDPETKVPVIDSTFSFEHFKTCENRYFVYILKSYMRTTVWISKDKKDKFVFNDFPFPSVDTINSYKDFPLFIKAALTNNTLICNKINLPEV